MIKALPGLIERYKGDILVLVGTACWGSSYFFVKVALDYLESFNLMALRFTLSFVITAVIFRNTVRRMRLGDIIHGFRLGLALFCANALFTFGVGATTISNAGFITGCSVIFVALIHCVSARTFPGAYLLVALSLCLIGVGVLTLKENIAIHRGDALCLAGAFMFAVHIFAAEKAGRESDAIGACILQFGFIAVFAWLATFLVENPILPLHADALFSVCALGVFGGAIGFICQLVGQRFTSPTRTGFIFVMEPLFALVFAVFVAGEPLTSRTTIGGSLLVLGVVISEKDKSVSLPVKD